MHRENIDIIVNDKTITINVVCVSDMPKDKLKQLVISKYLRNLEASLYKENNC
ncbi:hypothetical protein [Clostridium botulinum]|uniref:hypothetical protein n=1 Tax=Clostridium botulinum TaxID=1491 RepID=UPI000309292C|nr:hypothetical protein [Clostridium botulinum]MBY6806688.1 hypothetical protein [Clostridium botulinum]